MVIDLRSIEEKIKQRCKLGVAFCQKWPFVPILSNFPLTLSVQYSMTFYKTMKPPVVQGLGKKMFLCNLSLAPSPMAHVLYPEFGALI